MDLRETVFQSIPTGLAIVTSDGRLLSLNPALARTYLAREGQSLVDLLDDDEHLRVLPLSRPQSALAVFRVAGIPRLTHLSTAPLAPGCHLMILTDVSASRMNGLLPLLYDERRQLGQAVHDRVSQTLAALHFRLAAGHQGGGLVRQVSESAELARVLVQECSMLIARLGQPIHLLTAFQSDLAGEQGNIPLDLRVGPAVTEPPQLAAALALGLFREALCNVRKHAGATRVLVRLAARNGRIAALVRDDGAGFDVRKAPPPGASGIASMRMRAELLGGALDLSSRPGRTSIAFSIWL